MTKLDFDLANLRKRYSDLEVGPNKDYFIVPQFHLPKHFAQRAIRLRVNIPPTFPTAPPDNFLVAWGLSLTGGGTIGNYSGPVVVDGDQWGQFSHHIDVSKWHVSPNHHEGDSLISFIATITERLQEGA